MCEVHYCTCTSTHDLDIESPHTTDHLEIIDGEHELREAGQLEEKVMTGFQQLARVTQGIIWRRGKEKKGDI